MCHPSLNSLLLQISERLISMTRFEAVKRRRQCRGEQVTKLKVDGNVLMATRCQSQITHVHSAEVQTDLTMDKLASLISDYLLRLKEIQQLKAETSQRCYRTKEM